MAQTASPAAGLIQTVEGGVLTKRSSRLAGIVRSKDPATDGEFVSPLMGMFLW